MPWIREGECPPERCQGRCCEHIGLWYPVSTAREFLQTLVIRGIDVKSDGVMALVDIPQRCQHLTAEGLCGIYGKPERPQFCADWPTEPAQLINDENCGFSFRWEEEE